MIRLIYDVNWNENLLCSVNYISSYYVTIDTF